MKYTLLTAFMLTACTADPQGLRQPYDSNAVIVKIIDRNEALRQIADNMPINHAEVK